MGIRENYKDIMLVDESGRMEYFDISDVDFFDLKPEELIGTKAHQHYSNLNDENSTLMRAVNHGETILRCVQDLATAGGKIVRQESDTFCVKNGSKIVGAIEFAYYDAKKDVLETKDSTKDSQSGAWEQSVKLEDMIGETEVMKQIKRKLKKAADLESPVLLTGETGTGKEMAARVIHYSGNRKNGEFVYVNCSALPENLIESVLFGSTKGSFTDAEEKTGLFTIAHKGTIFLDEIQNMPVETQGKILRAIEEKRIRPIGSEKEVSVDTRIIASCTMSTEDAMALDRLRKDLYFRLAVIQLELPPLKERRDDILPLAEYYIKKFNREYDDRKLCGLDKETEKFFLSYDWPGNVRELKNTIESAFFSATGDMIRLKDIRERFTVRNQPSEASCDDPLYDDFLRSGKDLKSFMNDYEKSLIEEALEKNGSDIHLAARDLGLSQQMLKYNMEKFDIVL